MNDQQKETVELPQRYWLIIFTYILVQMSPVFGMDLFESVFPNMESVDHFVYWHLFSYTIAALVMLYLVQEDMKPSNMRDREGIGKLIGWSIGGVFIAFGAQYLANIINFQFIGIDQASENTMDIISIIEANYWFIIVPIVFAPFFEELIFRKIFFGQLYKRMNFFFAALLSSLIFSALHLDFTFTLTYVAMGFAFSYLYVKTKRIIVPMIAHGAMNATAVLIHLFVDIEDLERRLQELENTATILIGG